MRHRFKAGSTLLLLVLVLPWSRVRPPAPQVAPAPVAPFAAVSLGYPYDGTVADYDADIARAGQLGAPAVRVELAWRVVQPTSSGFDWTLTDIAVTHATAAGEAVLGILNGPPSWAYSGNTVSPAAFKAYARAAVARYPQVAAWELWNEPNNPAFWPNGPNPAGFAALVNAANLPAVTSKHVVLGGLSPAPAGPAEPGTFLNAALALIDPGAYTAVGDHPYDQAANLVSAKAQIASVRAAMTAHGVGGRQIWATEAGAFTGKVANAVDEATQATVLDATLTWWLALPPASYGPIFVYATIDDPGDGGRLYGMDRTDGTLRPAARVLASH